MFVTGRKPLLRDKKPEILADGGKRCGFGVSWSQNRVVDDIF